MLNVVRRYRSSVSRCRGRISPVGAVLRLRQGFFCRFKDEREQNVRFSQREETKIYCAVAGILKETSRVKVESEH